MRRGVTFIVLVVITAVVIIAAWFIGYGRGQAAGKQEVAADRGAFQSRGTSVAGGGFAGGGGNAGGVFAGNGGAGSAGGGTSQGGLTGLATSVANGTITLRQANNTTATINTTVTTAVQKLVAGKVSDLKTGDFVTVQGDRGSDNSVTAKSVTSINGQLPAGLIPSGGGNAAGGGAQGRGAAGGQAPGAASGSAPSGGGRGGQGAGGQGSAVGGGATVGRITRIDGTTLTLQGSDGSNVTVKTDSGTMVRTSQPGTISDIKAGDTLLVQADPAGGTSYNARIIYDQGTTGG